MDRGTVFFIGRVEEVVGYKTKIKIYDEYREGLEGLEEHNKIIIIFWFHKNDNLKGRSILKVFPRGDKKRKMRGVFATRSPMRPNPIGITIVDLLKVEKDHIVVKNLDALPGSPIIDIKPAKKGEIEKI